MIAFILAVCGNVDYIYTFPLSPPSRAAWIEIYIDKWYAVKEQGSPPSRVAWIEISDNVKCSFDLLSPPSRAAWIEIPLSAIISAMYRSLHSQVVCMQRFACVICLRSESSLIKNRVTAF